MYSGAGGIFDVKKNKFQYGLFRKKLNLKINLHSNVGYS